MPNQTCRTIRKMKNLIYLLAFFGLLCHASPSPKDTIYTNTETLMKEVRTTKNKTATYYLSLKDGDHNEVKVRIDLKKIDAEIPLYKSGAFDIKKLLALQEQSLAEPKQKLVAFDAKMKEKIRLEKALGQLNAQLKELQALDSLSRDSIAIDSFQKLKDLKAVEMRNTQKEAASLFNEYDKMMDGLLGNLRTQYRQRLNNAIEEAYQKVENKETLFHSVDDDARIWDIRLDLLKIDATREMMVPRRVNNKNTTEKVAAGKEYYLLHFAEFGTMFEEDEVKKVFSAIKLWEFHLNPYLVEKQFGLVCDDQDRTQHYINSIVDYKNYSGSLENTKDKPKPGDPLIRMEIASPGSSGKKGGTFGCTRNGEHRKCEKEVKYHGGMDIYAEQDSKLYSMYDGTVISLFDKIARDAYHSSLEKRYRFSDSYVGSLGNDIQIQSEINGKKVVVRYCHLNSINVKLGDKIKQGDLIGLTGRNGNAGRKDGLYASNAPHLHLQIKINDKTENPNDYLGTKFDANGLKLD